MNVGSVNSICNTQACKKQNPNFGAVQMDFIDARQLIRPGEEKIPGDLLSYMRDTLFNKGKGRIIASEYTALKTELGERVVALNMKDMTAIVEAKGHEVADKVREIMKGAKEFSIDRWIGGMAMRRGKAFTPREIETAIDYAKSHRRYLFEQVESGKIVLPQEPILIPVADDFEEEFKAGSKQKTLILEHFGMGPLPEPNSVGNSEAITLVEA